MESKNHPQTSLPLYMFIALILLGCIYTAYHVTQVANEKNENRWREYKATRDSLTRDTAK